MTGDLSKAMKRRLRELAALAYQRELGAELTALEGCFARWHKGELDELALTAAIHEFHDGAARDLYKQYVMRRNDEWAVSDAVERGVLSAAEAGPGVMALLTPRQG